MLKNINGPELLIVVGVIVLLFGARRLPELARSLGQSARELKKGMESDTPAGSRAADPDGETDAELS